MTSLDDLAQYILWGVSIVAFVGTAAMYLRGSADKGTITSLENSVSALKTEMEARELEHQRQSREKDAKIQAQDDKIEQQTQKIYSLGREINTLNSVVTQKDEIAHLQETLDNHHGESMLVLQAIREGVTR